MKYLILTLIIPLSGCFWQSVNINDIQTAASICGGVDKIVEISATFVGYETVLCSNRIEHIMRTRSTTN